MRKIILTSVFILLAFSVFSQRWSMGGRVGYGNYSMGNLKDFQEFRLEGVTIPLKTIDNYPVSPFYRFEIALNELKFVDKIGLFYAFNSTGARSTLSDYSGRVDIDAIINGNQIGLTFQKNIKSESQFESGIYTDVAFLMSTLKTTDLLEIVSPVKRVQKETYTFNSKGFSAEPGVYIKYKLNSFGFQLNAGYLIDFNGKLFVDGEKEQWLAVNNVTTKPQWGGVRLGLQVSYYFLKKQHSEKK